MHLDNKTYSMADLDRKHQRKVFTGGTGKNTVSKDTTICNDTSETPIL